MPEVVNLNHARKAKQRLAKVKTAADNRIKFGTPKHLRKLNEAERNKSARTIEQKRLDKDHD